MANTKIKTANVGPGDASQPPWRAKSWVLRLKSNLDFACAPIISQFSMNSMSRSPWSLGDVVQVNITLSLLSRRPFVLATKLSRIECFVVESNLISVVEKTAKSPHLGRPGRCITIRCREFRLLQANQVAFF